MTVFPPQEPAREQHRRQRPADHDAVRAASARRPDHDRRRDDRAGAGRTRASTRSSGTAAARSCRPTTRCSATTTEQRGAAGARPDAADRAGERAGRGIHGRGLCARQRPGRRRAGHLRTRARRTRSRRCATAWPTPMPDRGRSAARCRTAAIGTDAFQEAPIAAHHGRGRQARASWSPIPAKLEATDPHRLRDRALRPARVRS